MLETAVVAFCCCCCHKAEVVHYATNKKKHFDAIWSIFPKRVTYLRCVLTNSIKYVQSLLRRIVENRVRKLNEYSIQLGELG